MSDAYPPPYLPSEEEEAGWATSDSAPESAPASAPESAAAEYRARRERDWEQLLAGSGPLPDFWERYAERSHGWRQWIAFVQPLGKERPDLFAPLEPLYERLRAAGGVEIPPVEYLHAAMVQIGYMMASDVMWSQVESFYVNAAPRIHRVAPFTLRLGGISATEETLYLGVDDGHALRGVRRQIGLGVPKVSQVLRADDPQFTPRGDRFMPVVHLAHFAGGDRDAVARAVEGLRDIELGEVEVTHVKMARMSPDPDIRTPEPDVIAEIGLLGEGYRTGYHN